MTVKSKSAPWRDHMMPESFYQALDPGIRFAVRVIHAAGLETCQSCQGGKGHSYPEPTVDLYAEGRCADGFEAMAALVAYGLPVSTVARLWNVTNGLPYEHLWRVTLARAASERANDKPIFVRGYQAQ